MVGLVSLTFTPLRNVSIHQRPGDSLGKAVIMAERRNPYGKHCLAEWKNDLFWRACQLRTGGLAPFRYYVAEIYACDTTLPRQPHLRDVVVRG